MVQERKRMETLIGHVINDAPHESLRELNRNIDIVDDEITIDCTTLTNHCVCAENFEYFRKPEHMLQCLRTQKCFHCQRYRCMDKKYEVITASTKLLLISVAMGSFELFRFLHRHGCCLETKSGIFELRPLHLAIANGHFKIFRYLLAQQVDINATIRSQGTSYSPLMLAVMYGREDMVRDLLTCSGINLRYRNSLLQSPVLFAVQNNNLDLVNILLSAEELLQDNRLSSNVSKQKKIRNMHHPCAMLEALKKDNITVLKTLLENGCQVDFVFNGYHTHTTALVLASICNSHKCMYLLIDHGADSDVAVNGFTALDWAEQLGWTECIKALQGAKFRNLLKSLESDTDLSSSDASNDLGCLGDEIDNTVGELDTDHVEANGIEYSISERRHPLFEIWSFIQWIDVSEAIKRLIAKGNDVNTRDKYGRTCLHVAVEEQNVSGVRILLRFGADTELRDVCDATPLWHAVYWNKESMINELVFSNVTLECNAREDAYRIGLPWVDIPDQDDTNLAYRSTLYVAVKKNFSRTVRLFIEAGYQLNNENIEELVLIAKPEVKEMLLQYSSQPNSLFSITRNYLRRKYKRKIHGLLCDLDIPLRVKDCLLLRDIVDLKIEPDLSTADLS